MASTVLSVMIVIWVTVMVLLRQVAAKNRSSSNAARRNSPGSGSRKWYTEKAPGATASKRRVRSSDGHWLREEQDITCRQYGHNHPPTEGYIVLNGKKMLRTEADKYENSI